MSGSRFEVKPGRTIERDGKPLFAVDANIASGSPSSAEMDELVHIICACLNDLGTNSIPTTYLGGSISRLRRS